MKRISIITAGLLVVVFTLFGCAQQPTGGAGAGWITLIDGAKGLENFDQVGTTNWAVVDGVLQADKRTSKTPAYLVTKSAYTDFEIRVEFWASHDANSGIFMRCQDPKKIADTSCYEANIFDQRKDPAFGTGGIVYFATVPPIYKAGGKWNTYEISAKGPKLTVKLNGAQTVELVNKKYKSGVIALQHGQGVIKFRKVQIRRL